MGGSVTFVALASLAAVSSIGVGGNVPVDAVVLLGALPPDSSLLPPNNKFL
jgi:hypothetical protein